MHYVTAQVSRVTHIRHVKVMRYHPDHGDLLLVAGVGWKPSVAGNTTFPLDSASVAGRTMQTSAPVPVEDLPNDPEFQFHLSWREHSVVSALNVPIRIDGRTWGVEPAKTRRISHRRGSSP
ncbi:GAF domain-containing protein [Microvirga sp. GCM10011540]|uniref:GAF domain-containing protein n=1 Tax=Microvirga sp. GCM10011540 TaxID=3317338 RepID=UPI0036219FE5